MSDSLIYLSNVRLSFPHLAEPQRQVNEATGKERVSYNCELLMPQDHPGFTQFWKRYTELAVEKWKDSAQNVMQMIGQDRKKRCYGNGNEKINQKTFQPFDGYVGMVYITAGRDSQPQVIQADGTLIDANNTMAYHNLARAMYGGCRVNAAIKPWLQDNKHGRGVRCDLVAIQFAGNDTPFGEGVVDASKMFGTVEGASPFAPSPSGATGMFAPAAPASMPAAPFQQTPAGLPSFLS